MDSFPLRLHSPSPRRGPELPSFSQQIESILRERNWHLVGCLWWLSFSSLQTVGYCVCTGGGEWQSVAFVSLANSTSDVRMQETHMGKRMEEADLYHCLGLSKLLRTLSHLSFKLWSLVGNIYPPSGASVLLDWLYFPNSKKDWSRGGEHGED